MDDHTSTALPGRHLMTRTEFGRGRWWRLQARDSTDRDPFKRLFSHAPVPIVMLTGHDLIVERANEAALAVVGNREVIGRPLLVVLPELEGQGCYEVLREVMATGIRRVREEALIGLGGYGTSAVGKSYWSYTCTRTEHEQEPKVIVVLVDVTAQVIARRRLEELAAAAQAANRAKDIFIAMLSHELRNPLSPIVTALELLRMRGPDTEELALIERQVGRLARLVDDLLDVARIARGKVSLKKRPTETAEIVSAAVEMVQPLLKDRQHRLIIDVPQEGCTADVDADRMSQVVSNLLNNAAKFSESGSVISIAAEKRGCSVRLSVKDQGIGIEAESLESVFEAFEQHQSTGERLLGGLGLGLAIVRNLVRLHGGEVRAYSEGEGRGSEFVITLPWAQLPEEVISDPLTAAEEEGVS